MRQVVLDTETTGLEWKQGNRIVEIGCVELFERRPTGNTYHCYINPERDFELGAQEVTGLSLDRLKEEPKFAEIADEFLKFIRDAELIIHNASFDVGFIDYELSLLGQHFGRVSDYATVEDTLMMARQRYPGQRNSLDALCKRLGVDNSHRQLHGALLDAQLLADVYLAMTSGQSELGFGAETERVVQRPQHTTMSVQIASSSPRPAVCVLEDELEAHLQRISSIKQKNGQCLWLTDSVEVSSGE